MTDKELKRLGRTDLVEMLLEVTRENEQLRAELFQTQTQLEDKMIAIEKAGSLAEAALQLNGVFEAAQNACAQYTQNIQQQGNCFSGIPDTVESSDEETDVPCAESVDTETPIVIEDAEPAIPEVEEPVVSQEVVTVLNEIPEQCEHMEEETRKKCDRMEREMQEKCDRMEREAQKKCDRMLQRAKQEADEYWEYVRRNAHAVHLERHKSDESKQDEV